MTVLLADTSYIIDLMAGDESAIEKAKEIEAKAISFIVSTPTLFELYVGLTLSNRPLEEKNKMYSVLVSLPTLILDTDSAKEAGKIFGEKKRAGTTIDPEDAMIAGIAKVHGEKLLTRNMKHFSGIEGIIIEQY